MSPVSSVESKMNGFGGATFFCREPNQPAHSGVTPNYPWRLMYTAQTAFYQWVNRESERRAAWFVLSAFRENGRPDFAARFFLLCSPFIFFHFHFKTVRFVGSYLIILHTQKAWYFVSFSQVEKISSRFSSSYNNKIRLLHERRHSDGVAKGHV